MHDSMINYEQDNKEKQICEVCEGTGQICSFRGVSRFALSWEDCPVCGGMGFMFADGENGRQEPGEKKQEKSDPADRNENS